MYSLSYDTRKISSEIKSYCDLFDDELKYPSLDYLYKFRVLVCTLSTSGCLSRARHDACFRPDYFSYVFIDECASAHETMALIPIAGKSVSELNSIFPIEIFFSYLRFMHISRSNTRQYRTDWGSKTTRCSHEVRLVQEVGFQNIFI